MVFCAIFSPDLKILSQVELNCSQWSQDKYLADTEGFNNICEVYIIPMTIDLKKNWKLTLVSPVLYKPVFKMVRPIFCILSYIFQYYVCLKKGLTESLIFSYFLQWLITISAIWKDHSCLSFVWEWNCLESVKPHLVIVTHPPSLFKQCSILVFQAQQTCYSRSRVIYTMLYH